ncbi:MAG: cytochrome c oxidase assembly protein [Acidimicrobiia bacterium]
MLLASNLPPWNAHLDVWIVLSSVTVGYVALLTRWAPVADPAHLRLVWPRLQQFSCLAAVLVLWAGADWPVHDVAEGSMYSMHMVQHLLFTQIAAPLLLIGTPGWFLVRVLHRVRAMPVARSMTRFFPALLLHSFMVAVTHIPWFVDSSLKYGLFHFAAHVMLFVSALVVWLPILSTSRDLPRLNPLPRMMLIFLLGVMPTLPATWLAYADDPVYSRYTGLPKLWGWSALDDQQMAALIMKTAAGAIGFLLIAVIFFRWAGNEERRSRFTGAPAWQDRTETT